MTAPMLPSLGWLNLFSKPPDQLVIVLITVLTILALDGIDAQLVGLLRGVVKNEADIRVLCDAAVWSRNGGSGTFLTEDTEDLLGSNEHTGSTVEGGEADKSGDGLPDSFADFLGSENKSVPERINDQIVSRYDTGSALQILSIEDFLTIEAGGKALTETQ